MAVADPIRLTSLSHGAGCACKLGPSQLHDVLEMLGPSMPTTMHSPQRGRAVRASSATASA